MSMVVGGVNAVAPDAHRPVMHVSPKALNQPPVVRWSRPLLGITEYPVSHHAQPSDKGDTNEGECDGKQI